MVGYVQWSLVPYRIFYVADLPGHNGTVRVKGSGADWGYTDTPTKAIRLTPYWQRRFNADSRRCNRVARFQ